MDKIKRIEKNSFSTCVPLVSKDEDELCSDLQNIKKIKCDMIEWRRDYFKQEEILTETEEKRILEKIKASALEKEIIYTYRSHLEGGVCKTDDLVRLEGIKRGINSGVVNYIDIELENEKSFLESAKIFLEKTERTKLILSHHNFKKTPNCDQIEGIYRKMKEAGGDVLKLAVMPQSKEDVRNFIKSTLKVSGEVNLPMIAISMGALGSITRITPELLGGSLTYLVNKEKTAPGQFTYEEIEKFRNRLGMNL